MIFFGLWILYICVLLLVTALISALCISDWSLLVFLVAGAVLSLLTCILLRFKDVERKLDRLLAQREPSASDNPDAEAPERPEN